MEENITENPVSLSTTTALRTYILAQYLGLGWVALAAAQKRTAGKTYKKTEKASHGTLVCDAFNLFKNFQDSWYF